MDQAEPLQMRVIYWGLAFAITIVTGLWKAARMRGDINREWSARIDVLETGLAHKAIGELSVLRRKIDELIGGRASEFDPTSAIVDPSTLLQSVKKFERLISARRRVRVLFGRLLQLVNYLVISLLLILASELAAALHLSRLVDLSPWTAAIWSVFVVGLATGGSMFFLYWYLQHQLSGADILATEKTDRAK